MIDYSKLQVKIVKNCVKGIPITNKFCYHNDKVLLTDCDNTLMVAIPRDKFIINTRGDCLCRNEYKNLALLIDKETKQLYDTDIDKSTRQGLTAHIFKYNNKEFYINSKKLKIIGYDKSIYTVKTDISKKYPPLQFYIDDRFIGMICPIRP